MSCVGEESGWDCFDYMCDECQTNYRKLDEIILIQQAQLKSEREKAQGLVEALEWFISKIDAYKISKQALKEFNGYVDEIDCIFQGQYTLLGASAEVAEKAKQALAAWRGEKK